MSKMFPIQRSYTKQKPHPTSIPWEVADLAYSVYSNLYGRDQSLERMAERGGFGAKEMDELLPDWRERCDLIVKLREENEHLEMVVASKQEFLGKKVWVAERSGDGQYPKITLHRTFIDAMTSGSEMMVEVYGKEGNACEGDDPTEYRTIHNYDGIIGLTKIIFVRPADSFFPGDPDVSIYEKEIK